MYTGGVAPGAPFKTETTEYSLDEFVSEYGDLLGVADGDTSVRAESRGNLEARAELMDTLGLDEDESLDDAAEYVSIITHDVVSSEDHGRWLQSEDRIADSMADREAMSWLDM